MYKPEKNNIISDDSQSDDDIKDADFVLTRKLLQQNSDTECDEHNDSDKEFTKSIVERYGGKVRSVSVIK